MCSAQQSILGRQGSSRNKPFGLRLAFARVGNGFLSQMVPLILTALSIGTPAGLCGVEKKAEPASQLSQWPRIEAACGGINLDGTLRLNFPLGASPALKQLGLRMELEHWIDVDAYGQARSDWRVKGLQSNLVPKGRKQLRWQPLSGPAMDFDPAKITRALSSASSSRRWLIRKSGLFSYDIRSLDGRAWHYEHGALTHAEHPALGQVRFSTQGTGVTQVSQTDAAINDPPLLRVAYNENGRITSFQIGDGKAQHLEWNREGQLVSWRRGDGSEARFAYQGRLLSSVMESDKPPRHFAWQTNSGFGRGDSRWLAPVHLVSDGADEFSYKLTQDGFVLERRETTTGAIVRTLFNPRRRRLEQQNDGFKFVVRFRDHDGGTALEQIEVGGQITERYIYDDHGQLTGLQRNGEPERKLSYDESGRLMALEEGNTP